MAPSPPGDLDPGATWRSGCQPVASTTMVHGELLRWRELVMLHYTYLVALLAAVARSSAVASYRTRSRDRLIARPAARHATAYWQIVVSGFASMSE